MMFGFKRREAAPIQVYGKLPIAKDYLRLGMSDDATQSFRDWLDRGYSTPKGNVVVRPAWPARFLLGDDWGAPVQGLLWPSSDAGRKRPFPFVICVERKRARLLADLDNGFAHSEFVWRELASTYVRALEQENGQAALTLVRGQKVQIASKPDEATSRMSVEAWLDAVWSGGGAESYFSLLEALESLAEKEPKATLRLPLVDAMPIRPQVVAWVATLEGLGILKAGRVPTLIFPVSGRRGAAAKVRGFLTVFRGVPQPPDVVWLGDSDRSERIGAGDFCNDLRPRKHSEEPLSESVPPVRASIQSMIVRYRGRSRA